MEWMNRGGHPSAATNQTATGPSAGVTRSGGRKGGSGFMRVASVAMLFAAALLIVAMAVFFAVSGNKNNSDMKSVDTKNMQAVFLNGGQVYFGNITSLNSQSLSMNKIYYLRVNQQVQPNGQAATNQDISLVKLGCELHGPQDAMVINQSQVIFWENLKSDGQVAQAVAKYKTDNPNGQQCNTSASNSSSTTTNSSTPAATTSTTKKQ